jgi:hypothetical protein
MTIDDRSIYFRLHMSKTIGSPFVNHGQSARICLLPFSRVLLLVSLGSRQGKSLRLLSGVLVTQFFRNTSQYRDVHIRACGIVRAEEHSQEEEGLD